MSISRPRRYFRRFLLGILLVSFGFAATASYVYVRMKNNPAYTLEVAPTLFSIDIGAHQAQAYFSSEDAQYYIAGQLYQKRWFSPVYGQAGIEMWEDLAENGHERSEQQIALLAEQYHTQGLAQTSEKD